MCINLVLPKKTNLRFDLFLNKTFLKTFPFLRIFLGNFSMSGLEAEPGPGRAETQPGRSALRLCGPGSARAQPYNEYSRFVCQWQHCYVFWRMVVPT